MLEKKDYVSKGVKEYINKNFAHAKILVTCKNYILLSKNNTQLEILGSQSSVPRDSYGVFWLAQK